MLLHFALGIAPSIGADATCLDTFPLHENAPDGERVELVVRDGEVDVVHVTGDEPRSLGVEPGPRGHVGAASIVRAELDGESGELEVEFVVASVIEDGVHVAWRSRERAIATLEIWDAKAAGWCGVRKELLVPAERNECRVDVDPTADGLQVTVAFPGAGEGAGHFAFVFLGEDGSSRVVRKRRHRSVIQHGSADRSRYGHVSAFVDDVDGDGRRDVAVCAPELSDVSRLLLIGSDRGEVLGEYMGSLLDREGMRLTVLPGRRFALLHEPLPWRKKPLKEPKYRLLQLHVAPDDDGRLAVSFHEIGLETETAVQRMLAPRTLEERLDAWRRVGFPEEYAVFSTRPAMTDGLPILAVIHDGDGDLQFLCGTTNDIEDAMIVSLRQAIAGDDTVDELTDLPKNWMATRRRVGAPWVRQELFD